MSDKQGRGCEGEGMGKSWLGEGTGRRTQKRGRHGEEVARERHGEENAKKGKAWGGVVGIKMSALSVALIILYYIILG